MTTGLFSPSHILILLVIVLVLFGAKRLPELGRSLGSGMREFKHSVSGDGALDELPAGAASSEPRDSDGAETARHG